MKELALKYGCNPNQKPSRVYLENGDLPFSVLNGQAGYINLLDALNAWQLVTELDKATNLAAATSFKHVSPAGAAVAVPLSSDERKMFFVEQASLSDVATAYIRARGADRMSSYGDMAAVSRTCDKSLAEYLLREVSDGIIAPGYTEEALELLKTKRRGTYLILKMDKAYRPESLERKQVFGITFEQGRNDVIVDDAMFESRVTKNQALPPDALRDLKIAMITLKYTQSNSVAYAKGGQAVGIGAGQQSRIHCTRLAGTKADNFFMRTHPKVLGLPFLDGMKRPDRDNAIDSFIGETPEDVLADGAWQRVFSDCPKPLTREEKQAYLGTIGGVSLASDAFFPFGDNIERARRSGVAYIAQAGGSVRDQDVIDMCDKFGMVCCMTGIRLFHH